MSHPQVITFAPDGTAYCLWTEAVSLHELGVLLVYRASTIEFANECQRWQLKDRAGRVLFSSKSRSACLEWELGHSDELINGTAQSTSMPGGAL